MALSRRGAGRFSAQIWPGFVDAMTALILVLFFVLSIFMIVQFVLRDTITGQGQQLEELSVQVANLADALGLERSRADRQQSLVATLSDEKAAAEARIAGLTDAQAAAEARIATLTEEQRAAAARITDFEAQVASLIARNTDLSGQLDATRADRDVAAVEEFAQPFPALGRSDHDHALAARARGFDLARKTRQLAVENVGRGTFEVDRARAAPQSRPLPPP